MRITRVFHLTVKSIRKVIEKVICQPYRRSLLGKCGKRVRVGRNTRVEGWNNVEVGNDVSIGVDCVFLTTRAKIIIGNHVIFGPHVSVITGNHRVDMVGKYIDQVTDMDKVEENDQDVIFDGDNWIGANATILKGVRVGKGAVIAAGAVVTKSIQPYEIVGGVPAAKIGIRFNDKDIQEHEKILYGFSEKDVTDE